MEQGPPAATGLRVTPDSALTCSAWWRGINLIGTTIAKVPTYVYKRTADGKERDPLHPAYWLLRWKANEYQTAYDFKFQLTGHAVSLGNGYSYVYRDGAGRPMELWPLDPRCTYPVREYTSEWGTRLWYVTEVNGEERKLPAEDVLHIKGYSYDGLVAYPVYRVAREALGLALGEEGHLARQFSNGATPRVVLEVPGFVDDKQEQRLRETWERMHSGLTNAHRTAILYGGMKANALSFNNQDSQVLGLREFQIREIANFLGLPPHKLGDTSRTAYNSLEQENQSCLDECYDPWMVNWEFQCWDKLLTEEEKENDTHVVEFLRQAIVRIDYEKRMNGLQKAVGGPIMLVNEARELEGLPKLDDPKADELIRLNSQGGADNMNRNPAKPTEPDNKALRASLRFGVEDAARRVVKRIGMEARRKSKDGGAYCEWLDSFRKDSRAICTEILMPSTLALGACLQKPYPPENQATKLLDLLHRGLARLADNSTPTALAEDVDVWMTDMEATLPVALANELLGEPPCDTAK